jgi:hypothetical protein
VVAVVKIVVWTKIEAGGGRGYLRPQRFQLSVGDAVSMAGVGGEARRPQGNFSLVRQPGRAPVHLKR